MPETNDYPESLGKLDKLGKYESGFRENDVEYFTLNMKGGIELHLETFPDEEDLYTIKMNNQTVLERAQCTPFVGLEDLLLDLAQTIENLRSKILQDLEKKRRSDIQVGNIKSIKEFFRGRERPYIKKIVFSNGALRLDELRYTYTQTGDLIHNNRVFRESLIQSISANNNYSIKFDFENKKRKDEIKIILNGTYETSDINNDRL